MLFQRRNPAILIAAVAALLVFAGADALAAAPGLREPTAQDCPDCEAGHGSGAPRLDASYFTDADELAVPGLGEEGIDPSRIPAEKRAFCARGGADIEASLLTRPESETLSFYNPDGDFGITLCWLHTRFQRNAAYLARYLPQAPKPTPAQARAIIDAIAAGDRVVEVPGFRNLAELSSEYAHVMARAMQAMGYRDLLNLKLSSRMGDTDSLPGPELQAILDDIYARHARNPHPMFLRIRKLHHMQPFASHSLLLLAIRPIAAKRGAPFPGAPARLGYQLQFLDSNSPNEVIAAEYHYGDERIHYGFFAGGNVRPRSWGVSSGAIHLDYEGDMGPIEKAIRAYCHP